MEILPPTFQSCLVKFWMFSRHPNSSGTSSTVRLELLGIPLRSVITLHLSSFEVFVSWVFGFIVNYLQIIEGHPEMEVYVGLDVDPVALEKARARINSVLHNPTFSTLKASTFLENFRYVKSLLCDVDETLLDTGIDGILMDLGMSSMQVNDPERGFSVLANGPLDMRMDPQVTDVSTFLYLMETGKKVFFFWVL